VTAKERRKAAGLSQAALAAKASVGITTIYLVEKGYKPIYPGVRRALAQALDTTEHELFPPGAVADAH